MANRFLNNIKINDSYTLPTADGTADQIMKTNGSGQLSFMNQSDITAGSADTASSADKALSLTIRVKNRESVALTKGQVVYAAPSATPPSGNVIEVKLADNNGTNSMPAIGVLNEGLDAAGGTNDEGEAIMFGRISGINTSAFSVGDEVFVSDTAGALTATKPTGVKYIQKIGVVIRADASNGTIEIFGAGRTNDVPTPLYIDHANQLVGIGVTSPDSPLHIVKAIGGDSISSSQLKLEYSSSYLMGITHRGHFIGEGANDFKFVRNGSEQLTIKGFTGTTLGYVGIGTSSPSAKLHVNGSTSNVAARVDTTGADPSFLLTTLGQVDWGMGIDYSDSGKLKFDTSTNVGSNTKLTIDTTGNVGIGTTSPSAKLEVYNGSALIKSNDDYGLTIDGWGALYGSGIQFAQGGTVRANIQSNYNGSSGTTLQFDAGTSNSEVMRIHTNNNVGIGTTSPAHKLDVNGNIKMTETAATTDTDKFIVSDSGVLKYRTGAQVLSDIGGAASSHTHDDRYYTESEIQTYFNRGYISSQSATNLAVGWYTIATNTGDRALGEFQIWETAGSRHQSVLFNASHHFGVDDSNDITVLANSRFGTDVFRYIRIKESGAYSGAALQIYIDNSTNTVNVAITGANAQVNGWVLKDWVADGTDPGDLDNYALFTVACQVDLDNIQGGGIATTGGIFSGGATTQYRNLTTADEGSGNGLDADTLDGQHASAFQAAGSYVTTNTSQTISGSKTYSGINTYQLGIDAYDGYGIYWGQSEYSFELIGDSGGGGFSLLNNGTNVFQVAFNDNIGIGVTSPAEKLDVAGSIKATGQIWSGYDAGQNGSVSCSNWFRSSGATGWYAASYGGGIYMTDTTNVTVYNNKAFRVNNTGTLSIRSAGDIVAYYSDERLKTNLGNITNAVDKVKKLNGFYYTNNDLAQEFGYTEEQVQVGVSAQEVENVMPEVVKPAPFDLGVNEDGSTYSISGDDYKTVKYEKLVPLLIEAIKEQQNQIDELKAIINGTSK